MTNQTVTSTRPDLRTTPEGRARPATSKAPALRRGERFPGTSWIMTKPLGKGGVGEVFEVEHALLGRRAALKLLQSEHLERPGLAARIADEGRWLASVRHDNLVDVLDLGILSDGRPYLVLELLEGRDLRRELARLGVFSVPAALEIVAQALRGLGALHRAGLVHRDIKLENIFLCEERRIKILDLGAAEPVHAGELEGRRGPSLGTPRTMAPEQTMGKPVDERADLYAIGLVLYELVAGRGPFDDVEGLEALHFAHCERTPPPPSRVAPQPIPTELDALVLRALAKSPDDRFPSADMMLAELLAMTPRKKPRGFSASYADLHDQETALSAAMALASGASRKTETGPPPLAPAPPGAERAWTAVVSALALAALALGVAVGRLLPPTISAPPSASFTVAR